MPELKPTIPLEHPMTALAVIVLAGWALSAALWLGELIAALF